MNAQTVTNLASLTTGATLEARSYPAITLVQLKAYSQASGDPNPIHLDEEIAKKMGLPGVIAHGMLVAGLLAERARELMAGRGARLTGMQTRFRAMTLLGDVLTIGGTVKEAGAGAVILDLQARNQRGEIVCSAQTRWTR